MGKVGSHTVAASQNAVILCAILSRIFILGISLFIGSVLSIPDYDSSSNLPLVESPSLLDTVIYKVFGRFLKWDAVYFVRIAEYGYEYEQFYAFFPFYPLVMRYFSKAILLIFGWITEKSAIILAGYIISNVSFVVSAVQLYKLGCITLRDESLSFISAILYTITPASIFMSALYTESIYALMVFSALYFLATNHFIFSSLSFFFATFTRSNGILLTGFIIFRFFYSLFHSYFSFFATLLPSSSGNTTSRKGQTNTSFESKIQSECTQGEVGFSHFSKVLMTVVMCVVTVAPYFGFQLYGKLQFCDEDPTARPWCNTLIPSLYGFVQNHYWNQGFFNYYEMKQIPNFLLAGPMVVISFCGIYVYLKGRIQHIQDITNGNEKSKSEKIAYFDPQVLPYPFFQFIQAILTFSLTFMHVQVITRFFSSSPAVYWFCGHLFTSSQKRKHSRAKKAILGYFLFYMVLGTSLFVLFYPWT